MQRRDEAPYFNILYEEALAACKLPTFLTDVEVGLSKQATQAGWLYLARVASCCLIKPQRLVFITDSNICCFQ